MRSVLKSVLTVAVVVLSLTVNAGDLSIKSVDLPISAYASKVAEARKLPERIAISEPVRISAEGAEGWSTDGRLATWHMRLSVKQGNSLAFHANEIHLPAGSVLRVSSGKGTDREYTQADVTSGLWALHHPGQSLLITLLVAEKDKSQVRFAMDSVQIGFADLFAGITDGLSRPSATSSDRAAAATTPAPATDACARVNQQCYNDGPSKLPARSTALIVIDNQLACTATLLSNTSADFRPLLLTAGHCRVTPNVAAGVVAYWQEVSPCGTPLNNTLNSTLTSRGKSELAFSPFSPDSANTATRKDYWLIDLQAAPPPAAKAVWSGFNAVTGLPISFLATHHGGTFDRQLASGKTIAATGNGNEYTTSFYGRGISQGSSGGGLFDQNGRSIGWLSGSSGTNDTACYASEADGDAANRVAFYISMSASFNYTKATFPLTDPANDSTPLKPHLDPGNTGRLTTDSLVVPVAPEVTLTPSSTSIALGQSFTMTWAATESPTGCTASALPQSAASSWSGSRPSASAAAETITPSSATTITFKLDCTNSAGTGSKSVSVTVRPLPSVTLTSDRSSAQTGESAKLTWSSSNTTACTASGAWSGSKTTSGNETVKVGTTAGTNNYTLSCAGPDGTDAKTVSISVSAPPPPPAPAPAAQAVSSRSGGGAMSLLALLQLLSALSVRSVRYFVRCTKD